MDHLINNSLISATQYAFRPNYSTTLALEIVLNRIHRNVQQRKPTLAVYVDLSKAYDTISHEKLLHKLRHEFNFTPETVAFFASYFRNREQSTHTQHAQSKTEVITHGIPQGSTLSTTFFLLYINDILKTVPDSKVYTYADDTTLVITTDTLPELEKLAQSELNNLINYFHNNNLVPNPTKTTYTTFYPSTTQQHTLLNINEPSTLDNDDDYVFILNQTTDAKLLGIIIQDTLKYSQTITNVIKKLQAVIHNFRYATKLLPTSTMKQLYYSHAYPHLIGNITIWGSEDPSKTYLQPLVRAQKKLIRIILNLPPRTHTRPLMQKLHILNIPNLYILRVCIELHPFIHTTDQHNRPEHDHNYLWIAQVHEHNTRHSQQQQHYIPNPHQYAKNKEPKLKSEHFNSHYTAIWNALPLALSTNRTMSSFKKKLKKYLLDKQ